MILRRWLIFAAALILGTVALLIAALQDFDLSGFDQTELTFQSDGNTLSGTLILPQDVPDPPVVIIVHGDGPQDRFSADGYLPLFNVLLDAGIGIFTWDKPGIGQSEGQWRDQSMQDRANEAIAAFRKIETQTGSANAIGFLGFSQAGWVIPKATQDVTPAFSVLIGPAVSWQRQGAFFTRKRLEAEGAPEDEIAAQLAINAQREWRILAPGTALALDDLRGMTRERYNFVARNHTADASEDIARMRGPVLAVWGAEDLNVDATSDAASYATLLPQQTTQSIVIIPDATHGLLRAGLFNYQLIDEWPSYTKAIFLFGGRHTFAPGALEQITNWINARTG